MEVSRILGTDLPKDFRKPSLDQLGDVRLAGDPHCLILLFQTTLKNWIEFNVTAGETTRRWRSVIHTHLSL